MLEKTDSVRRRLELSALHDLLLRTCPPNAKGHKSIPILADFLTASGYRITPQAIYEWIKRDHIPPPRAKQLVDLCADRVTKDDLEPYVYNM